jgi:hypothetical protein
MDRLTAMQTFVKVIETGSFSAAARQLRVGQPAVSRAVAQLEERLGLSLLLRSSRSFSATEAGQIFYEHARLAIAQADEAELAARGVGDVISRAEHFPDRLAASIDRGVASRRPPDIPERDLSRQPASSALTRGFCNTMTERDPLFAQLTRASSSTS